MQFPRPAPWRGRACASLALALALGLLAPLSTAAAQDSTIEALSQQLDRLQREVQVLQRQVAVGQPATDLKVPEGEAGPLLLRLNDLENTLRNLTGRVEELSHRIDETNGRVDKLSAQVDTRIGALENAPAAAGGEKPLMSGQKEGGVRVLGTMPQGAAPETAAPVESAAPGQTAALPAVQLPGGSAKEDYDYAFGLLRQADYPRAEAALKAFLEAHPKDELAGNAKYWLGETFYVRGDYKQAAVVFAEGFKDYPDSSKAPDNLLKLGMSLSNVGERGDACKTYTALLARYPNAAATIRQRAEREKGRLGC
ncbi:tol-pal system protein YbgF [Tistlia consotensis]|uniref:Cell division coordinator CpoB n=2 Tax=Tistlia TaxID=1321364 RepID=A0A1Y6BXJ7_9PROT|nr:tol-pal system protein YbgF [Tistlia consotensis USBA 355]SNR68766.1 tol-pal system protein YbgF [Tistlia consotensis]